MKQINIQNQIEEIFNIFQIDIEDHFKTTGPYGNYVTKIEELFNTGNTRFTFIRKGREVQCPNFSNEWYKWGSSQTFQYMHNGLFFFGLVDSKYNEDDLSDNGWDIKQIAKYKSFDKYLESDECSNNMMINFKKAKKWFQIRIVCAAAQYANKNNVVIPYLARIQKEIVEKFYTSKYDGWFETLRKAFFDFEPSNIDMGKEIVDDLFKRVDEKDFDVNKYMKTPAYQNLRNVFRNNLVKQVIKDYGYERNQNELLPDYKYCEAAHIISFEQCIKEKRKDDICSPDNGMLIDPNLHTYFDRNENVKINTKGEFIDMDLNKVIGKLNLKIKSNAEKIKNFESVKKLIL